jgi:hypothetical protein
MFVDIMKYDDVFSALSANLPVKRSVERKEEVIGPESQTAFPL